MGDPQLQMEFNERIPVTKIDILCIFSCEIPHDKHVIRGSFSE